MADCEPDELHFWSFSPEMDERFTTGNGSSASHHTSPRKDFAYKLAGLLSLRARRRRDLRFQIAANVCDGTPRDNIIVHLSWRETDEDKSLTYFINVKQQSDGSPLFEEDFVDDRSFFSIKGYYNLYKRLRSYYQNDGFSKDATKQCNPEDCRFIIYTGCSVLCESSSEPPDESPDFPFVDIISTGSPEDSFSFSEQDETIWNLVEQEEVEEYRTKFLPRLRIFSRQVEPEGLDDLILDELSQGLEMPLNSMLPYQQPYLNFLKNWWQANKVDYCLTERTPEVENIILHDIKKRVEKSIRIEFQESEIDELANMFEVVDVLYVSVVGVKSEQKLAKMLKVLQKFDDHFLIINSETLEDYSEEALKQICKKACKILLVDADSVRKETETLVEIMASKHNCKIIFVSSDIHPHIKSYLQSLNVRFGEFTDTWTFDQLSTRIQSQVMNATVSFQGREIALSLLWGTWRTLRSELDGPWLAALAAEAHAVLGTPAACLADSAGPYLSRTFRHAAVLKPEVLKLQGRKEHFALSGFPREVLEGLLVAVAASSPFSPISTSRIQTFPFPPAGDDPSKRRSRAGSLIDAHALSGSAWTVLSHPEDFPAYDAAKDERKFQNLCRQLRGSNVHWLVYENGLLLWKDSHGHCAALTEYIDKKNFACTNTPVCFHNERECDFLSWSEKVVLVTGDPGIGKSIFLSRRAAFFSSQKPTDWIIVLELNNHRDVIQSLPDPKDLEWKHVVHLLAVGAGVDSSSSPAAAKRYLESSLFETGNVAVFVDGFDEVIPRLKEKILRFLELLLESKVSHLWVTCRTCAEKDLKKILQVSPIALEPLTPEEEVDYLCAEWMLAVAEADSARLRFEATDMVREMVEGAGADGHGRSVSGIPLHAKLVAATRQHEIRTRLRTGIGGEAAKRRPLLVDVYQDYVAHKRDLFKAKCRLRGEEVSDKAFVDLHIKFALLVFFSGETIEGVDIRSLKEEVKKYIPLIEKEKTGIINRIKNGIAEFFHFSFVEYFVALWLKENPNNCLAFAFIIHYDYWKGGRGLVSYFLDLMLSAGLAAHEAVACGGGAGAVGAALREPGVALQRDAGGRTALHVAARRGDAPAVAALLDAGAPLGARDDVLRWTALEYADCAGQLEAAEALLRAGAAPDGLHILSSLAVQNHAVLEQAAFKGFDHLAQLLVEAGARTARPDGSTTALHAAASGGHQPAVAVMLRAGLHWDARDAAQRTPLHCAGAAGHVEVSKYLLSLGAEANARDIDGSTPTSLAARGGHAQLLGVLHQHGGDLHVGDRLGRTPIYYAAFDGLRDTVAALLQLGADPRRGDRAGVTPMHVAAAKGHYHILQELIACKDKPPARAVVSFAKSEFPYRFEMKVNLRDAAGHTPLHMAAWAGAIETLNLLLASGGHLGARTALGRTALHYAAQEGHYHAVERLLALGSDPNHKDKRNVTPLHVACVGGHATVAGALLLGGARAGVATDEGRAPLHLAAEQGHRETALLLLRYGAPLEQADASGRTALHWACGTGRAGTARALLAEGADPEAVDGEGRRPLHFAAAGGHGVVVRLLLGAGVDARQVDRSGATALHVSAWSGAASAASALLASGAADAGAREGRGWTALHVAAQQGSADVVKVLLDAGADINAVTPLGLTPLHIAVRRGRSNAIRQLLAHGAAPDTATAAGRAWTPLHVAAYEGQAAAAELLLGAGADPMRPDSHGRNSLDIAYDAGKREVFEGLVRQWARQHGMSDGLRFWKEEESSEC